MDLWSTPLATFQLEYTRIATTTTTTSTTTTATTTTNERTSEGETTWNFDALCVQTTWTSIFKPRDDIRLVHGGHKLGTSIQQHWQQWTENQVKLSWSQRIPLPCNGNTCGNLESQGPTHGRQGFVFEAFRRLHKRHLLAKWFSQKFSGRGHYSVKGCCRNFGYLKGEMAISTCFIEELWFWKSLRLVGQRNSSTKSGESVQHLKSDDFASCVHTFKFENYSKLDGQSTYFHMTPRATYRMRCCERVRFAETLDRRTSWFIASSFNHLTRRTHHFTKLRGFGGHSHIIIDFPSVWMTNAWENLGNQKVHGTIPLFAMLSFPMQKPLSWQMRKRGKSQDPSSQPKREATENPPHASACFRAAFPWRLLWDQGKGQAVHDPAWVWTTHPKKWVGFKSIQMRF